MTVKIRIGLGSFGDFDMLVDGDWDEVPCIGDSIRMPGDAIFKVNKVEYVLASDYTLWGVQIIVKEELKPDPMGMIG